MSLARACNRCTCKPADAKRPLAPLLKAHVCLSRRASALAKQVGDRRAVLEADAQVKLDARKAEDSARAQGLWADAVAFLDAEAAKAQAFVKAELALIDEVECERDVDVEAEADRIVADIEARVAE